MPVISLIIKNQEGVIYLRCVSESADGHFGERKEMAMIAMIPMFGAAGYALLYLLFGGGLGGAILIFIVAKMLGR
jgi:hypothetical protein